MGSWKRPVTADILKGSSLERVKGGFFLFNIQLGNVFNVWLWLSAFLKDLVQGKQWSHKKWFFFFFVHSIFQHRNIKVSAKYQKKSQKSVWWFTLMWNILAKKHNLSFCFKSFILLTLPETVLMSCGAKVIYFHVSLFLRPNDKIFRVFNF